MDLFLARLAGITHVQSLKDLCLWRISIGLQVRSNIHGIVQQLLLHLPPDDVVEVLHQKCVYDDTLGVCPYDMLLPRPRVLLASAQLRGKLLAITRGAVPKAARLPARDALLRRIESAKSQAELIDALEFGTFLCEMGWHKDGMLILEKVANALCLNPSWNASEMALDCANRQLAAAVAAGQVTAADTLATRVEILHKRGLGRSSGLLAAAAAGLARWHLLKDRWDQAAQYLLAALDALPADGVPADLSAELPRLTCELLLTAGRIAPLVELAPQAMSAACRPWDVLHPQMLATVRMMTDFQLLSGNTGLAQDLCIIAEKLTRKMYGKTSVVWQRQELDHALLALRLIGGEEYDEYFHDRVRLKKRPYELPVPDNSWWQIERTLANCQWLENVYIPIWLNTWEGQMHAARVGGQSLQELRETTRLCEQLFGPSSVRLSRVLTSLARHYFMLIMDHLLELPQESTSEVEPLLKRAMEMQSRLGVPRGHRDSLVTRITLASFLNYKYYSGPRLLEAEELLRGALDECYGGEQKSHLDLAEHCLRSLASIYKRRNDERVSATQDAIEMVQEERYRLSEERLPARGMDVNSVLPPQPWTQREMATKMAAALREMLPVAPPGGPTVAPPSGSTVALPVPQPAAQDVNGKGNGL